MNYNDAKLIQRGDTVILAETYSRRVVKDVSIDENTHTVCVTCYAENPLDEPVVYHHSAIAGIASDKDQAHYYQILAFNHEDDIDPICSSHIYPSYVSCMSRNGFCKSVSAESIKDEPLMLQSNPHDGLAFTSLEYIPEILLKARTTWPKKEFHIIKMDSFFFGKRAPRWVVNS